MITVSLVLTLHNVPHNKKVGVNDCEYYQQNTKSEEFEDICVQNITNVF